MLQFNYIERCAYESSLLSRFAADDSHSSYEMKSTHDLSKPIKELMCPTPMSNRNYWLAQLTYRGPTVRNFLSCDEPSEYTLSSEIEQGHHEKDVRVLVLKSAKGYLIHIIHSCMQSTTLVMVDIRNRLTFSVSHFGWESGHRTKVEFLVGGSTNITRQHVR
jgi:hypothetical protein